MATLLELEEDYTDEVIGDTTLVETFEDAADRFPDRPAQYYKGGIYDRSLVGEVLEDAPPGEFNSLTYEDMRDLVRNLAAGFHEIGVEAADRVALFSNTRMEWAQSDYALLALGGVVTTVYATSTPRKVQYLLDHPGAVGVVVENGELLDHVLEVEADLDELEWIVSIDDIDGHEAAYREDVYTLGEIHELGSKAYNPTTYQGWLEARSLDDLASVIYTSGTTGQPKGVRLTHGNFRANINQLRRRFGPNDAKPPGTPAVTEETRVVSYLPLAHVFERLGGHFIMFASGASVAYAESPDTLQEDFAAIQPTAATSVPRVYERMYKAIRQQAQESPVKARIFAWATGVGRDYHRTDDPGVFMRAKRTIADALVFKKVRSALGGNLEFMISGGGSLSPDLNALYHGMGLPILEGYGLTETAPVLSANPPEAPEIGTIGPPLYDVEIEFDTSVVEFDGEAGTTGELLVRGPNVMPGYLDDPVANDEAFTEDGWFRTGDLVTQRPDGYLVFEERLKEIYVLSTGLNLAPGPIEDAFATNELVEQCMLLGDGEPFVAALVVPSVEGFDRWATERDVELPDDPGELREVDAVREAIEAEIEAVNLELERHERIRQFRLVPAEFTEEADLLTPSMKKKRRNILDRYAHLVEEIYAEAD